MANEYYGIITKENREDLECLCCRNLMVEPTTLTCGHSFCRLCLAQWHLSSNKQSCMICQSAWQLLPNVSITIRNLIESQYCEEYEARCLETKTPQNLQIIRNFEQKMQGSRMSLFTRSLSQVAQGAAPDVMPRGHLINLRNKYFGYGMLFMCVVGFVISFLMYFLQRHEELTSKALVKWTSLEVEKWLKGLGPITGDTLLPVFRNMSIDGALLKALSEMPDQLNVVLTDLDILHQKGFKAALDGLIDLGTKPPQDIWEYKNLHLFQTYCVVYLRPMYPRLFVISLYFWDYNDAFLPLLHRLCPVVEGIEDISLYTYQFPQPTSSQWIDFIWRLLFLPHLSIYMDFASKQTWNTNMWSSAYIMLDSLILTYLQLYQYYSCFKHGWRYTKRCLEVAGKTALKTWCFMFLVYEFFNFIPMLLCNLVFYFFAILGPVGRVMILKKPADLCLFL